MYISKKAKVLTFKQLVWFFIYSIGCVILITIVSFLFHEPKVLKNVTPNSLHNVTTKLLHKFTIEWGKANEKLLDRESIKILSIDQQARLNLIQSGQLTKKNIEIVVARYKENISWTNFYSPLLTVYDKSNDDDIQFSITTNNTTKITTIPLPNIGRECNTYLHHIVNNYHNLADVTVFTQGTAPTRGYNGHRNGGGHLLGNSTFHDYVLNPNGHFIFTGALWFPTAAHIIRYGYNSKTVSRQVGQRRCFDLISDIDGVEMNGRFSLSYVKIIEHIAKRCLDEQSTFCSVPLFWDRFIKLNHPVGDVVYFAQGAIFSATSEQIHRRPLSDYEAILQECSRNNDPSASFFMEWLWYYLLTSDIHPCPDIIDITTSTTIASTSSTAETTTSSSSSSSLVPMHIGHKAFEWASRLPYYEHFDFLTRVRLANSTSSTFIAGVDNRKTIKKKKRRKTFLRKILH